MQWNIRYATRLVIGLLVSCCGFAVAVRQFQVAALARSSADALTPPAFQPQGTITLGKHQPSWTPNGQFIFRVKFDNPTDYATYTSAGWHYHVHFADDGGQLGAVWKNSVVETPTVNIATGGNPKYWASIKVNSTEIQLKSPPSPSKQPGAGEGAQIKKGQMFQGSGTGTGTVIITDKDNFETAPGGHQYTVSGTLVELVEVNAL